MPLPQQSPIALITGAASGGGLACARRLARDGAFVTLLDRDAARGKAAARALGVLGRQAAFIGTDMSAEAMRAIARDIGERHGGLDIAVLEAGAASMAGDDALEATLRVLGAQGAACAGEMIRSGRGGAIINVCCGPPAPSFSDLVVEAVAAEAVSRLTQAMAAEYSAQGVNFNAVAPGDMIARLARGPRRNQDWEAVADAVASLAAAGANGCTLRPERARAVAQRGAAA